MRSSIILGTTAGAVQALVPQAALAQRAGENVATQSSDAFGRTVGQDKSGLYSSDEVRGFNPVEAGNARLNGLYFDQVDRLSPRLTDGNTIRVGPAAQHFPFPAPTGLVDYHLTEASSAASYSFNLEEGGSSSMGLGGSFEIKQPLDGRRLGISGGAGARNSRRFEGGKGRIRTAGGTIAWRPAEDVSLLLFSGAFFFSSDEARPTYYPVATEPLPRLRRGKDLSLTWTDRTQSNWLHGGLLRAPLGALKLEAGLFYTGRNQKRVFADLLFGVSPEGTFAARRVIADANNRDASLSGEVRLVRQWQAGSLNHQLVASLRGRARDRRFGGAQPIDLGAGTLKVRDLQPERAYTIGAKSQDEVRQLTFGLSYSLVAEGRFGLDASLSKTRYRKAIDFADPTLADPITRDRPLLWNLAGRYNLNPTLSLYGSLSRGMEEALAAPEVAANRSEAPPAIRTEQIEAGFKYAITPHLTLIAGGFSITKPNFNLDPASNYRELGQLRNRGLELSLTGRLASGLTVVGGTMLLDPKIAGEAVDTGLIKPRPVGQIRRRSVVNLDWRPKGGTSPISFDLAVESLSSRMGNAANTLRAPPRTVVNLGARYRFKAAGGDWLVRPVIQNLFNEYGWNVSSSGGFTYIPPRALTLQAVADF